MYVFTYVEQFLGFLLFLRTSYLQRFGQHAVSPVKTSLYWKL